MIKYLVGLAVFTLAPLSAQFASPNDTGAAISHIQLNVSDVDAQQRFWTLVGGTQVSHGKLQMMQFPGIYIILRKQDPTGGTIGSVVDHFGFHVKRFDDWLPKWKAAGIKIIPESVPTKFYLAAPDDIRFEVIEDPSISTPIAMDHIHLYIPDPQAAQTWYIKNFGAIAGKRGSLMVANVPGAEITLDKHEAMPQAPTKGRSVDHIGFEVKNINQFVKNLEASGIHTETPIRSSADGSSFRRTYITDPWGTYIELTEGLLPKSPRFSKPLARGKKPLGMLG